MPSEIDAADYGWCQECGREMFITPTGVSHHLLKDGTGINYDADGDHVPVKDPIADQPGEPTGFVDALTGQPVLKNDPKRNSKCPSCGSYSVISDQPSISRCLKCGWNDD